MSLLFRVVYQWKCHGTHHKLAVDALRLLPDPDGEGWRNLFLTHHATYLTGSKAPDQIFKDFQNHVLHVSQGDWGGALDTAEYWFGKTVRSLRMQQWSEAVYAAGVLSHYVTDPVMPLHTGQSVAESEMHRACEWSVSKSYDHLQKLLQEQLGGWPTVVLGSDSQWLRKLVRSNAVIAHKEYEPVVTGYDFERGVSQPELGLTDELKLTFARLLGLAAASFAAVLQRAIETARVQPPATNPTVKGLLSSLSIPINWVTSKMADATDRREVRAIYEELQQTGKVEQTLPAESRVLRELQPESTSSKATKLQGSASRESRQSRPALTVDSPVVDAPSIGPKTADRLKKIGIKTVGELLQQRSDVIATRLQARYVTQETVLAWQQQTELMCRVPGLRTQAVQLLVGCGVHEPEELARMQASQLVDRVNQFVRSDAARHLMRDPQPVSRDEVQEWITTAQKIHDAQAA